MSNNWRTVPLSEIADINPRLGKNILSDDSLYTFVPMASVGAADGRIDVSTKRPYVEVKKGFTSFQSGDVLFAKITPCMENGKMAVVPDLENHYGFGSTEFHVIRPKDGIDPKYVYYFVSSSDFRREAGHNMTGAVGQKRVPTDFLKQSLIPLPPTPEDQKRIVAEIEKQFSRLDEAVASLKRIQANLKRYKAAVLKAAVEGKLTEQWRKDHPNVEPADQLLKRILAERRAKWEAEELAKMKAKGIKPKDDSWKKKYKEPVGPDTANLPELPELPEGWVWTRLGSLPVDVFDGPFGSNLKSTDYVSSGVRVIRLENIGSSGFIDGKESFITEQKYEQLKKHKVGHGDIIFSSFVANETRVVMLPGHIKKAINKADCFCVRINDEAINKRYIETFLATRTAYEQLVGEVHGATRPRINTTQLKDCHVSMSSLAEQNEIVSEIDRRLSVTEELETTIETNLKRAERLRQTILQRAFSGGLV